MKIGVRSYGGIIAAVNDNHLLIVAESIFDAPYTHKGGTARCSELTVNGYSDWRLPSPAEARLIVQVFPLNGIEIWTSDKYNYNAYWCYDGSTFSQVKQDYARHVLPVREEFISIPEASDEPQLA